MALGTCLLGVPAVIIAERDVPGIGVTLVIFGLLFGLALAWLRRPATAIVVAWMVLGLSTAASMAKFSFMGLNVHVADVYFYLRDGDLVSFLAGSLPVLLGGAVAGLVAAVGLARFVHRGEAPGPGARRLGMATAATFLALMPFAFPAEGRSHQYHVNKKHFTSSFFVSFVNLADLVRPDPLNERLAKLARSDKVLDPASCAPGGQRPDIVMVLSESAFSPDIFPDLKIPPGLQDTFRSFDGAVHPLRVEVHGGGTATSLVTAMSGLPAAEFGWLAPYLTSYLKGRIRNALPAYLKECGYATFALSPLPFGFVDEGAFMTSAGISRYGDYKRMGWRSKQERDKVYFEAALKQIRAHRATSDQPVFMFVMTMTAHMPYDFRFDPETKVAGEPFGNGPAMDEYLRRLVMARQDLGAFEKGLAAEPGRRGTLVVEFGDHQPVVTRTLLGGAGDPGLAHRDSVAYRTFWGVRGYGFTPPVAAPSSALDIAFLPVTVLELAGIPLDPIFTAQAELRAGCDGRFFDCRTTGLKDRFLARLVLGGGLRL